MKVVIHPTRATQLRTASQFPEGTTCFWGWDQVEMALRATNGIRADETLTGLVIEDRGVTLLLESNR